MYARYHQQSHAAQSRAPPPAHQQQALAYQQTMHLLNYYQQYAASQPEKAYVFTADQLLAFKAQYDWTRALQLGSHPAADPRMHCPTLAEQAQGLRRECGPFVCHLSCSCLTRTHSLIHAALLLPTLNPHCTEPHTAYNLPYHSPALVQRPLQHAAYHRPGQGKPAVAAAPPAAPQAPLVPADRRCPLYAPAPSPVDQRTMEVTHAPHACLGSQLPQITQTFTGAFLLHVEKSM